MRLLSLSLSLSPSRRRTFKHININSSTYVSSRRRGREQWIRGLQVVYHRQLMANKREMLYGLRSDGS
ncbi:hypothetical protein E2C01_089435 [Portunus trituberculatus]|uniref:Uncharacterized protein n=1 Tax=Portunus trituberculatus TaxID=210409 RepID=A0A5B7JIS5_PORTR|nr:hypothetical protein [Portunus trituberculatus]